MDKSSFDILYRPFFDKGFYKKFIKSNKTHTFLILIIIAICTLVPTTVGFYFDMTSSDFKTEVYSGIETLPPMNISDSTLGIDSSEPIVYYGSDSTNILVLDTSITDSNLFEKLSQYGDVLACFGKSRIYLQPLDNQTVEEIPFMFSYDSFEKGEITHDRIFGWVETIMIALIIFVALFLIIWSVIVYFIHFVCIKVISTMAWPDRKIINKQFDKLIVLAMIPSSITFMLLGQSIITFKLFVLSIIVTSFYVTFAIKGYREDELKNRLEKSETIDL